mmetsp:Transcript_14985/g.47221  ORF Transcript_14985/g.47221 Transcript_14985/m.47221 type:complete len:202 (-) Transcript_14985:255-860(-)
MHHRSPTPFSAYPLSSASQCSVNHWNYELKSTRGFTPDAFSVVRFALKKGHDGGSCQKLRSLVPCCGTHFVLVFSRLASETTVHLSAKVCTPQPGQLPNRSSSHPRSSRYRKQTGLPPQLVCPPSPPRRLSPSRLSCPPPLGLPRSRRSASSSHPLLIRPPAEGSPRPCLCWRRDTSTPCASQKVPPDCAKSGRGLRTSCS